MKTTSNRRWAMVLAATLLGGCADATSGRGFAGSNPDGGKADDAEDEGEETDDEAQLAFVEAVGRCEKLADRGRRTIGVARIEQRLGVESQRTECLREATDETLAAIEATLEQVESSVAGDGEDAFTAWRDANAEFCELLVAASEDAAEKDAEVHEAACVAEAEVLLAEAIVAFADLGGAPSDPPEAREAYGECYDAFDTALEADPVDGEADPTDGAPAEGEELAPELEVAVTAHRELAECIRVATEELDEELAMRVVASFPGRAMANLQEQIDADLEGTAEAAASLCTVLGAASIDAGDPEAELQAETCGVATSIWRAQLIGVVIPELAPADGDSEEEEPADGDGP